jgi:hypothetical protein
LHRITHTHTHTHTHTPQKNAQCCQSNSYFTFSHFQLCTQHGRSLPCFPKWHLRSQSQALQHQSTIKCFQPHSVCGHAHAALPSIHSQTWMSLFALVLDNW